MAKGWREKRLYKVGSHQRLGKQVRVREAGRMVLVSRVGQWAFRARQEVPEGWEVSLSCPTGWPEEEGGT